MSASAEATAKRRAAITEAIRAETGINDAMIADLVNSFYRRVRGDPLLGPIFETRVKDWDAHLVKMRNFWSSVALLSGVYHGQPMRAHLPLPVDAQHFDRWLALFEETAHDRCPPRAADHFVERAHRIAESLELGIATASGALLAKGERFHRSEAMRATESGLRS